MKKKSAAAFVLVILAIAAVVVAILNVELDRTITPEEQTYTAIGETAYRIDMFMSKNLAVPLSLDVLPRRDGYSNSIIDGWGNGLVYAIDSDRALSLSSYGEDGKPGGDGSSQDITVTYQIRQDKAGLVFKD
jgi:hypothetical protein